jgi:hypothetical protein
MKTNLFLVPEGKKSVKKKKFRLNGKSFFFFLISWVNKRKKHFVLLFLNARLRFLISKKLKLETTFEI